jgi:hypothetical protein
VVDGCRQHGDPFGHLGAERAEQLPALQPAAGPVAGEPHLQVGGTRVVALVVIDPDLDGDRVEPGRRA